MPDQQLTQVRYGRRGAAGWITLDRPAKRNALTPAMVGGLHQALDLADRDPALAAIVITGARPTFCAGADLGFFSGLLDEPDGCERFVAGLLRPLAAALARLRTSPRPVIAAVNGACAAGGVELAVACDLIVAATGATCTDAHSRRGLAPAIGGAAGLVRWLGAHRARQLMLLADSWHAATLAGSGRRSGSAAAQHEGNEDQEPPRNPPDPGGQAEREISGDDDARDQYYPRAAGPGRAPGHRAARGRGPPGRPRAGPDS
jgi:enoyl-CoA hydratase/carnithine racemase